MSDLSLQILARVGAIEPSQTTSLQIARDCGVGPQDIDYTAAVSALLASGELAIDRGWLRRLTK